MGTLLTLMDDSATAVLSTPFALPILALIGSLAVWAIAVALDKVEE
jgi:tetrahydromethanopterin S-methyltransferase subunit E